VENYALKVIDGDGFYGKISDAALLKNDKVPVTLDNGKTVLVESAILKKVSENTYGIPLSFKDLSESDSTESRVIPVVQEEVRVQKEEVERARVVVNKIARERQETVDVPLTEEHVHIERIPKNVVIDAPIPVRYEGDDVIISLVEEVLVVEKRLLLKEEVRITQEKKEVHKPQTVTLYSEEVKVERIPFSNDGETRKSL
jgi:uncharacterized protein (TIGR02271 family)